MLRTVNVEIPSELELLLFMHGSMADIADPEDGLHYSMSDKGNELAMAVKSLMHHRDLMRFSIEMIGIGARYGAGEVDSDNPV